MIEPAAAAFCVKNCIESYDDDVWGLFDGTLRTTFIYTPAFPVPEPSSFLLVLTGAALLGFATRIRAT